MEHAITDLSNNSQLIEGSYLTNATVAEYLPRRLIPLPFARDRCRFLKNAIKHGRSNSQEVDRYCPNIDHSAEKRLTPQNTLRNYGYLCEKIFLDDSNYLISQKLGNRNTQEWT